MTRESSPIYLAETDRVHGRLREALETARQQGQIPVENIASLPDDKLGEFMRWWRIWTVTLMSLYKGQWNGKQAAQYLMEAKGVFVTYYSHTEVAKAARKMKVDPEGHEYQMRPEMLRDFGKFLLHTAQLTGNPIFIDHAVEAFSRAVEESQEDTSVHALATMEREIANRQNEGRIDWEVFQSAYRTAVLLSPQAGGLDRAAATSWWYTQEALIAGRTNDLKYGLKNLMGACQAGGVNWFTRYPLKEAISSVFGLSRRLTAPQHIAPVLNPHSDLAAGA